MTTVSAKLKDRIWYFKKGYFSQLLYDLRNGFLNSPKASSLDWCRQLAIHESGFYKQFGIKPRQIQKDFPDYVKFARTNRKKCPIEMGMGSPVNLIYNLILHLEPKSVVETGVAYGYSTLGILLGLENLKNATLWSIDMPIPNLGNEPYVGCIVHEDLRANWSLIRMPDISGLPVALGECQLIDFFHYDSDSSYRGRLDTLKTAWNALAMGGHIMCNDIHTNRAFKDFSESTGREPIVIAYEDRYLGLIRK